MMRRQIVRRWLSLAALPGLLLGCQAIKGPHANQPLLMSKQPVEGKFGAGSEPTQFASAEPKAPPLPSAAFASGPPANLGPPVSPALRPSDAPTIAMPVTPPDNVSASPQRRPNLNAIPAVRSHVRPEVPASPVDRPNGVAPASPAARPGPEAPAVPSSVAPPGSSAAPRQPIDPLLSSTPAPAAAFAAAPRPPMDPLLSTAVPPAATAATAALSTTPPAPPPAPARFEGKYGHDAAYTTLQGVVDRHHHGHVYLRYCDPKVEDPWGGKVCLEDDPRLASVKEGDVLRVEGSIVPEADSTRRHTWKHYPRFRIKNVETIQSNR